MGAWAVGGSFLCLWLHFLLAVLRIGGAWSRPFHLCLGSLLALWASGQFSIGQQLLCVFISKIDITARHLILLAHISNLLPVCQRVPHSCMSTVPELRLIQINSLMQALSHLWICVALPLALVVEDLWLPQRTLRISFWLSSELLLLLQEIPLTHLVLLLLQILQMYLLLLLSQVGPRSLASNLLAPMMGLLMAGAILSGGRRGRLLLALHGHLLHLLFHYEIFLLLFQDHQLLVLRHSFELSGSHFGVEQVLLVAVLERVPLKDLLLFG